LQTLRFEGPTLEDAVQVARGQVGQRARIVSATRVRRGGVAGFFTKEHIEVEVVVDPPGADAPGAGGANGQGANGSSGLAPRGSGATDGARGGSARGAYRSNADGTNATTITAGGAGFPNGAGADADAFAGSTGTAAKRRRWPLRQADPLADLIEEMAQGAPSSVLDLAEKLNGRQSLYGADPKAEAGAVRKAPAEEGTAGGETSARFAAVLDQIARDSGLVPLPQDEILPDEEAPEVARSGGILSEDDAPAGHEHVGLRVAYLEGGSADEGAGSAVDLSAQGRLGARADEGAGPEEEAEPGPREDSGPGPQEEAVFGERPTSCEEAELEEGREEEVGTQACAAEAAQGQEIPAGSQTEEPPEVRTEVSLQSLGLPARICAEVGTGEGCPPLEEALAQALARNLPPLPRMPRSANSVVAVVGAADRVSATAKAIAQELGTPEDEVALATCRMLTGLAEPPLTSPEAASDERRSWRWRGRPSVVAIEAPVRPAGNEWAAAMLRALEPTMCWGVADALHKPEDLVAWSDTLGGLDALELVELEGTSSPAAALSIPVPVGRLDGETAQPEVWARALASRLRER